MFEYCINSKRCIAVNVGDFLSHKINWLDNEGKLVSVDVINSWDRLLLAEQFASNYYTDPRYGDNAAILENRDLFIEEVAIKIDEFIPKRYFVKLHNMLNTYNDRDNSVIQRQFKGKDYHAETRGLIYHYPCNESKGPFVIYATKKQISYLEHLASESGYILNNTDSLKLDKARELIGFLLGEKENIKDVFEYLMYE